MGSYGLIGWVFKVRLLVQCLFGLSLTFFIQSCFAGQPEPPVKIKNANGALVAVTEEFPPYQFRDGLNIKGLATEIVEAVFAHSGLQAEVRMYSWARAYKHALNSKNVAIFSLARTVEREHLFLWVGEVVDYEVYLYRRADRTDIQIHQLQDAQKYTFGGVYDDVKQDYLVRNGFELGSQVQLVKDEQTNLRKLYNRRIDLMPSEPHAFQYLLGKQGYEHSMFEKAFMVEGISSKLYFALSKASDQAIYLRLKASYQFLRESGVFAQIKNKYLSPSP